jgi:hypothetical protein
VDTPSVGLSGVHVKPEPARTFSYEAQVDESKNNSITQTKNWIILALFTLNIGPAISHCNNINHTCTPAIPSLETTELAEKLYNAVGLDVTLLQYGQ